MKIQEIKHQVIQGGFKNKNTSKATINSELHVQYSQVEIGGHYFYLDEVNGTPRYKVGCQFIDINDVKTAIRQLKGTNTPVMENKIFNKNTNKIIPGNLVEASENYFIFNTGRCYPKTNTYIKEVNVAQDVLTVNKYSGRTYWRYKDRKIVEVSKQEDTLEKLEYIVELAETIDKCLRGEEYIVSSTEKI